MGFGQTQRVDLHPVSEAALGGVRHAVALERELVPELDERAHLAHLLNEPHAGVDEEGDRLDHLAESLWRDLAGVADRVKNRYRRAHGEGNLLHGRGARLLEVVAADVGRVPPGDLGDRVGHHVGDKPQGGLRREDVGPAGEVLLDDVVLGRPGERPDRRSRILTGGDGLLLGDHLVHREQPHSGGVDCQRGVHLGQRDICEQRPHVADVRDRHPYLADLAQGQRVVGVVTGLGRQVKGH